MSNTNSPQVQMIVDTQLINDWQNISPFKSNGQLSAIQGPDGSVQAYTTGTDGNIYNIWRDSHSATGWSFLNINYPDAVLNPILAVGQDLDNNIVIMQPHLIRKTVATGIAKTKTGDKAGHRCPRILMHRVSDILLYNLYSFSGEMKGCFA